MKKSLSLLKIEAETSTKFRGHNLKPWHNYGGHSAGNPGHAYAFCKYCQMRVDVVTNPLPNEIDIGGEAVALSCPES